MNLKVKKATIQSVDSQTLILFSTTDKGVLWKPAKMELSKNLLEFLGKQENFESKPKQSAFFPWARTSGPEHVLVVGLGSSKELSMEDYRQAAAQALHTLKSHKSSSATIPVDDLVTPKSGKKEDLLQALGEGFTLGSYNFDELKTKKDKKKKDTELVLTLVTSSSSVGAEKALGRGVVLGEATNFARRLGDMPGNLMTPTILFQEAQKAAKGTGLKVTSWDKPRIEKERMNCFLSVNRGSLEPPKFIILEYKGGKAKDRHVCFVGKGLTFDTGGISIKPSAGMEEMKFDMCGGASVIGAMVAIARLKLKVNVIAYVPATDNMPGPLANKPGDIHVARNGVSVEVNNTDAEGRLILADALVYASEQKPRWIVDAATLTGAMVIALGNIHTGYFTSSNDLSQRIEKAAHASGERVWRMPVVKEHGEDMKGTYADLSNTGSSRGAGSATAAAFLKNFVPEEIPYAHFDVAGTAWNAGNRLSYNPKKGATGSMVRTFVTLAERG